MEKRYKLSDAVWGPLVKLFQLAMFTGQDVTSIARSLELKVDDDGNLAMTDDSVKSLDEQIDAFAAPLDIPQSESDDAPVFVIGKSN